MIRSRMPLIALLLCLSLIWQTAPRASAQAEDDVAARCLTEMYDQMAFMQTIFRAQVLGHKRAAEEPAGATRIGSDGRVWIKTGPGQTGSGAWRRDGEARTLTDADMDLPFLPPRPGILARREARTSDLVPDLTQAYRSLTCHTETVCQNARLTRTDADRLRREEQARVDAGQAPPIPYDWIPIAVPGCIRLDANPLPSCQELHAKHGALFRQTVQDRCSTAGEELLAREAEVLKLLTAYDAAYRSFLQFSGVFDRFLTDFKGDLLTPIEQATSVVSHLSRIPCFLSQCSE